MRIRRATAIFQGGVAGPFADAVNIASDLAGPVFYGARELATARPRSSWQ